ncbi:hypothetical protein Goari_003206 [Gossypium aridum]|uniref:Uncharacterized protein n=1 Tax=Gossypium aridum TaxID=34290 RepID=A0A7J8YAS9_GOSAI|nr:hypothetical protein [Gossypium aridum]
MVSVLSEGDGDEVHSTEDRITKKVWFKDKHVVSNVAVAMDLTFEPTLSWKERLMGKGHSDLKMMIETIGVAKLDFSMDSRTRGHFDRMAMYVHLDKPLIM